MFKVEVGEVLAVEQVWGQLLQAAAGQIDGIDPLGHHLDGRRGRGGKGRQVAEGKQRGERETWSQKRIIPATQDSAGGVLPCSEGVKCRALANLLKD